MLAKEPTSGKDQNFEFDINAEIAANLSCPVLLVANGRGKSADDIIASTQLVIDALEDKGVDTVAAIINRLTATDEEKNEILSSIKCKTDALRSFLFTVSMKMKVWVTPA